MKRKNYLAVTAVLLGFALIVGCGGKKQDNTGDSKTEAGNEAETTQGEGTDANASTEEYVTLGEYKGLPVEYLIPEITDDDVEMYIQGELEENAEYKAIEDRPAQEGDSVNIDFTGKLDGEEFEGGSGEDYDLVLGDGDFLEDFEANLMGKNSGETVTFKTTFPEDYDEELGGKEVEFTVTINSISEVVVQEYNDAYVASVSDCKTTAEYEAQKKEELLESEKENSLLEAGESALSQAVENATVTGYPQELYDTLYAEAEENYQLFAEFMGMEYEDFLTEYLGTDDLSEEVLEQVNETLVVQAIAKAEGLEVTDADYEAEANKMLEEEGYESLESYEEDYGKDYIMRQILRDKVLNFLYESAEVSEVTQDEMDMEGEELDLDMEDDPEAEKGAEEGADTEDSADAEEGADAGEGADAEG